MYRTYRIEKLVTLGLAVVSIFCFCGTSAIAQQNPTSPPSPPSVSSSSSLDADAVWQAEVVELAWSKVVPALETVSEKTWLADDYQLDGDRVVVKGVAGSQPAMRRAVNDYILPRVEQEVRIKSIWDRQVARQRIYRELERIEIVVDEFSQTFYRQVGDEEVEVFTREAVLLNLSDSNIEPIVHDIRHDLRRVQRVRSEAIGFVGIAMTVAFIVCWIASRFLNRVTRGYYVWPIRLVTGLVLLSSLGLTAGIAFSILRAI